MPTDQPRAVRALSYSTPTPAPTRCSALPDSTLRQVAQAALLRVASTVPLRPAPGPDPAEVHALCAALRERGLDAARRVVDDLTAHGHGNSDILRGHLPAVARLMGEKWERDEVSFVEVAQTVGRLQRLVHQLRAETARPSADRLRRAVFCTLPDETHTLGVVIAADAFRQHGWEIDLSLGESRGDLLDQLSEQDYAVLGLSVGSVRTARTLGMLIPDIRAAAPETRILVSGAYIAAEPEAAARFGADGWARDIPGALREMARLARSAEA